MLKRWHGSSGICSSPSHSIWPKLYTLAGICLRIFFSVQTEDYFSPIHIRFNPHHLHIYRYTTIMNEEEKDDIVKKLCLMDVRHVALSLSRPRWENGDKQSFHAVWLNSLILSSQGHRREDEEFSKEEEECGYHASLFERICLPHSSLTTGNQYADRLPSFLFYFILFAERKTIIPRWERTLVPPRDYWEHPIKIVATHITFRPFPVTTGKTRWQLGVKNELELTSLSWFGTF